MSPLTRLVPGSVGYPICGDGGGLELGNIYERNSIMDAVLPLW